MLSNDMEQIEYDNFPEKIIEKFPEYKNSPQYFDESNKDLPYIILGNLSLMAFENVDKEKDLALAEKLVKFTDEIFNSHVRDAKLVNLFAVEVLEKLVGSSAGARLAKTLLHDKSLEVLEQILQQYSSKDFLEEYRRK